MPITAGLPQGVNCGFRELPRDHYLEVQRVACLELLKEGAQSSPSFYFVDLYPPCFLNLPEAEPQFLFVRSETLALTLLDLPSFYTSLVLSLLSSVNSPGDRSFLTGPFLFVEVHSLFFPLACYNFFVTRGSWRPSSIFEGLGNPIGFLFLGFGRLNRKTPFLRRICSYPYLFRWEQALRWFQVCLIFARPLYPGKNPHSLRFSTFSGISLSVPVCQLVAKLILFLSLRGSVSRPHFYVRYDAHHPRYENRTFPIICAS